MAVSVVAPSYYLDLCVTPEPYYNNKYLPSPNNQEQMEYNSFYAQPPQQQDQFEATNNLRQNFATIPITATTVAATTLTADQQNSNYTNSNNNNNSSNINNNNNNSSNNNNQGYNTEFVDSPPDSKEPWPIEFTKANMHTTNGEVFQGNRKRRIDWSPSLELPESGPDSKIPNIILGKDQRIGGGGGNGLSGERRKSQGRLGWPDDIDIDLSNELTNNGYLSDSLLSFSVFKQELPSPPNQDTLQKITRSPVNGLSTSAQLTIQQQQSQQQQTQLQQQKNLSDNQNLTINQQQLQSNDVNGNNRNTNDDQANSANNNNVLGQNNNITNMNNFQNFLQQNGFDGNNNIGNQSNNENGQRASSSEDCRFQYVLAAATSIATKTNEESLTYLNQGQSYEIKLKKVGDLSSFRGKIMKSVIKICFHERRLQYMEREQMQLWQGSRPGERILDVDVPLSYGLIHVNPVSNSNLLNTIEIIWDPMKEVGVYIKVNCISTEFTPKKHGGEKGVPFRIQVETYWEGTHTSATTPKSFDGVLSIPSSKSLHAAACQIKVFKLKGADRKHKQDREKIQKRPPSEQDKYQRSCECTILSEIANDTQLISTTIGGGYSPEDIRRTAVSPILPTSPIPIAKYDGVMNFCNTNGNVSSTNNQLPKVIDQNVSSPQDGGEMIMDDLIPNITKESTSGHLTQWLNYHRLTNYNGTFSHFSGSDLLRMSKEDLQQICGLADGIRMFNILHSKAITPRLTIYVSFDLNITYHAIYLHSITTKDLLQKICKLPGFIDNMRSWSPSNNNANNNNNNNNNSSNNNSNDSNNIFSNWPTNNLHSKYSGSSNNLCDSSKLKIFMNGPYGIHVLLTDEVLSNIKDESLFILDIAQGGNILMKAIHKTEN